MGSCIGKESNVDEKQNPKPKPKPPLDDELQSKRFIEAAKELQADETCTSFDDVFSIVASSAWKTVPPGRKDKAERIGPAHRYLGGESECEREGGVGA